MARRPKRTRLYLNNQISRSQTFAYLAQNEINQATIPTVEVEIPNQKQQMFTKNKMNEASGADCFVEVCASRWYSSTSSVPNQMQHWGLLVIVWV